MIHIKCWSFSFCCIWFKSIITLQVIASACKLEIFDHLDELSSDPPTAQVLAAKYDWDAGVTRRLLDMLVSMKLVEKQNIPAEEGLYGCTYCILAKPLHNYDTVSVHFNHFYCTDICDKQLTYIYLYVDDCWLTSYIPQQLQILFKYAIMSENLIFED